MVKLQPIYNIKWAVGPLRNPSRKGTKTPGGFDPQFLWFGGVFNALNKLKTTGKCRP
jgi:hypothetical protein